MKNAHSPLARSPGSNSITDHADATDLFFHGFLLCCWVSLRLSGARIVTDYLLQEESCAVQAQIQSERNPISSGNVRFNEIREKIKSVASVLSVNSLSACGLRRRRRSTTMWYCLPDSSLLLSYKSRDFVPGYSRSARYCLPDKITWYYYASSRPSIVII